jgi:hypothetical protein
LFLFWQLWELESLDWTWNCFWIGKQVVIMTVKFITNSYDVPLTIFKRKSAIRKIYDLCRRHDDKCSKNWCFQRQRMLAYSKLSTARPRLQMCKIIAVLSILEICLYAITDWIIFGRGFLFLWDFFIANQMNWLK